MYSTFERAARAANRHSVKTGLDIHIFFEDGTYSIGTDYDADTFFHGVEAVATVTPDGVCHKAVNA